MTAIAFLFGVLVGSALSLVMFEEIYRWQCERIGDLSRALAEVAGELRVEQAIAAIGEDDMIIGEVWLEEAYERSVN